MNRELRDGMGLVRGCAIEYAPAGVEVRDWREGSSLDFCLWGVVNGRERALLEMSYEDLTDCPGGAADTSGGDLHWPKVRAWVRQTMIDLDQ
ncbi:MAG: hypothetical protein ACK47B_18440 [Armatimonadota bacterium]